MQTAQIGIARLLRYMVSTYGASRVSSWRAGSVESTTYAEVARRAVALGQALTRRGIGRGAIVGTLCPATEEHLECYLGVPAYGAALHTLNAHAREADAARAIRDAGDAAIVVDIAFVDYFARLVPSIKDGPLRLVILVGEDAKGRAANRFAGSASEVVAYDALIAEAGKVDRETILSLTDPPEGDAASICYTSGTTGLPRGVAYSHRSLWLQAMSLCAANSLALSHGDTVLPAVPLCHVNGWGIPFATLMAGANLVLPGDALKPARLDTLLEECGVTLAAGVPTIWTDLLDYRAARGLGAFRTLRRITTGGAAVPRRLIEKFAALGVTVIQAWGMTETSSMSVMGAVQPSEGKTETAPPRIGRVACGLEIRVVAPTGGVLPSNGTAVGEIEIRGPWVTARYLGGTDGEVFDGEWLRTGDLGTIDAEGGLQITDRLKDAIKSGGEWISSQALEATLLQIPGIADAAVIGRRDERWQERPLAVLVPIGGTPLDTVEIRHTLRSMLPKWWIPDRWATLTALPRTASGKPDKARLREMLGNGELPLIEEDGESR